MIYDYQERKQQCFTNSFSTVALAVIDNFNFNQMICLNKTLTSTLKKKRQLTLCQQSDRVWFCFTAQKTLLPPAGLENTLPEEHVFEAQI